MSRNKPDLDGDLEKLYAQPLEGFVAARNALASRLQKEGRKEEAARIKALRKPSASAWVVNQVVRERRGDVDALLDAGGRVRAMQREAMIGGGGKELRAAMEDERKALARARRAVDAILAARERTGSPAVAERALATLRAVAEGAAAPGFQEGQLTEDVAPLGLEELTQVLGAHAPASPPPRERAAPAEAPHESKPARVAPAETERQRKQREAEERRREEEARREEEKRREEEEAHARRVEEAEATLRAAEAEAHALEAEVRQAEQAARRAEQEAKRAAIEAQRAQQEADRQERLRAQKATEAERAKRQVELARHALLGARRAPHGELATKRPRAH